MIRSTKVTTKYSNKIKSDNVNLLIDEYTCVVKQFVDIMWKLEKVPSLVTAELRGEIEQTWLGTRLIQCAGKQASGIVRGTRKKQEQRLYVINKLLKENKSKRARKLQKVYDKTKVSKPSIQNIQLELDERFIKLDLDNATSFNGWVELFCLGNKLKIKIPFKRTKHFNKLFEFGILKKGIRLSKNSITFIFNIESQQNNSEKIIGIDIGQLTTVSCSDNQISKKDNHNHDLTSILTKLSRKKNGSKSFKRTQTQRVQYINWTINQLNLNNVKEIKIENIKNMRKGKTSSKILSHWTYTEIFDKLNSKAEELNVLVTKISPTYTSQRCSSCGWTRKSNRKGKLFKCDRCSFELDADLNGARNIALKLKPIGKQQRLKQISKTGFYWLAEGQESIVPDVQINDFIVFQ